MITFKFRLIIVIFFCSFMWSASAFGQTIIKVVDQNNSPLPNAIVEYVASQPRLSKPFEDHIYVMDQVKKEFAPEVLIVPVNSLVSFPNSDDIRHHVYSFSTAKTFELKLYAGKPKSPVRFETKGVVVMGCNIHDSMVGYIYVTDKAHVYMSDEKGEVLLEDNLALSTQLQVWHSKSITGVDKHTLFTINQKMIDNNEITLVLTVNSPEPRGSFEELAVHEH